MRSHGVRFPAQPPPLNDPVLLDRVYALENRGQATGIAEVFLARFSGEPSASAQGSLENRRSGPAVLWRTVRFPDTSARPRRNPTSRPSRNAPDLGRQPGAFSTATRPGEPATQRILRSGFIEIIAEDFAIVASATTIEAEGRRPVRPPSGSEMNPKRAPSQPVGPFASRPSSTGTDAHRLIPPKQHRREARGYAWRERNDRKPMMAQSGRGSAASAPPHVDIAADVG